jgi:MFS family permease
MLALFAAMITATVVTVALPQTVAELGGSLVEYTWIITSMGLASTATTPLWGRLADAVDKKTLLLVSLGIFTIASAACAFVQDPIQLIIARTFQGVGVGGIQTLVLIAIAAYLPPRQRIKYNGVYSAVVAGATVTGPLIGGLLTDTEGFGWRATFAFGVPLCVAAFILLALKLKLNDIVVPRKMSYLASTFIVTGIGAVLAWMSFVGVSFSWSSVPSIVMLCGALIVLGVGIYLDTRSEAPILPYRLLRQRDVRLITVAAVSLGLTMSAAGVFLAQYLQIGREYGATLAGVVTIPSAIATLVASTFGGRWSSRTGKLKAPLVLGMAFILASNVMLSFIGEDTSLVFIAVALAVSGAGVGLTMQNTLVAIQNAVPHRDVGSASSALTFIRSLGGTVGFQIIGALFALHLASVTTSGFRAEGIRPPSDPNDLSVLTGVGGWILRAAYVSESHLVYVVSAVGSLVALICLIALRPIRLRDSFDEPETVVAGDVVGHGATLDDKDSDRR